MIEGNSCSDNALPLGSDDVILLLYDKNNSDNYYEYIKEVVLSR